MLNYFSVLIPCLIISLFSSASNAMYIDRAIVDFLPLETPRQDVKVINDSDDNLYVKIEVLEVLHPGTDKEQRVPITTPDDIKLLVTPAKMVIPPKGTKLLRLINLDEELKEEKVYRINVTPIMPPLQDEGAKSKVRVVIAYQVLVLVAPKEPLYKLKYERKENKLLLKNTGNSYVVLTQGKQCPSKDQVQNACFDIPSKRLYPGNNYVVDLPYKQPTTLSLKGLIGNETINIP